MRIRDLGESERPREKAWLFGIETLSDAELLAVLIGSGIKGRSALEIAADVLRDYQGLAGLSAAHLSTLAGERGLSRISALKLEGAFELARRINAVEKGRLSEIKEPKDLYERYRSLDNLEKEALLVVMLSGVNKIVREKIIARGTEAEMKVSLKEVITELLLGKARRFALVHNHPGGTTSPSEDDVRATRVIARKAGEFGVELYDHVIVFEGGYYSFREHGWDGGR